MGGGGSMEVGEEGDYIYNIHTSVSLHCHHRSDPCIKMGNDKSHFNVSIIVREKVTNKTVSTDRNF